MAGDSRRTSERTVGSDQSRSYGSEERQTWQDIDSGRVIGDRTSCQNCGRSLQVDDCLLDLCKAFGEFLIFSLILSRRKIPLGSSFSRVGADRVHLQRPPVASKQSVELPW